MKPFALQSRMLTMRGVFYPTGYMFVMLPRLEDAERLDHDLESSGYRGHDVMLVPPDAILKQIGATISHDFDTLPSLGTEAATVLEYERLARQGDCAVLIHAPTRQDSETVMDVVHTLPFSRATRYRPLVIEELN
ncbi:RNA-binding protein [Caenimonas terrae]|uniref:RNA-binding protein n=1 Tax=Caenimonas terrae TaxID=696074 RepID=A0ABW0NG86_9BURK